MKQNSFIVGSLSLLVLVGACGISHSRNVEKSTVQSAWNDINSPNMVAGQFISEFSALPIEGNVKTIPWTDSYWPSYAGGIASRWQMPGYVGESSAFETNRKNFEYTPPTSAEVANMSAQEINLLSPAEEYDIYVGDFSYPTVKLERDRLVKIQARDNVDAPGWTREYWEGICHGWAPASINFLEPKPVTLAGASNVNIPFTSSDIKALLAYHQHLGDMDPLLLKEFPAHHAFLKPQFENRKSAKMLGLQCGSEGTGCDDNNAGSFHLVLANIVGKNSQSFVFDRRGDKETWNQPVVSFRSKIIADALEPSADSAPGTVREVEISTQLFYTAEVGARADRVALSVGNGIDVLNLKYRLELNAGDEIVGGKYLSGEQVDFYWQQGVPEFVGHYKDIKKIYDASIR